jgi:uncharacterized protein (TIGR02594 family)
MAEPVWLAKARTYLGLREVPGKNHNPKILDWWRLCRLAFTDDETPWCAGFVGGILEECGIRSTRSGAARSYAGNKDFVKLPKAAAGAIMVHWRGSPKGYQGHVNFVAGKTAGGTLVCIGGNQNDTVSAAPYSEARLIGYYWPRSIPLPTDYKLPVVASNGQPVTSEA